MNPTYDEIGIGYAERRRPDARIEQQVWRALGDALSVLNVGAGAGSYEPRDRLVIAVEPSQVQLAQRPGGAASAVRAVAEALPFADGSFDACLAILTLHHWSDQGRGLSELRRVARKRVVVLTHDFRDIDPPWLVRDYFPGIVEQDRDRFPPLEEIAAALGGARIEVVPIPADCTDGFLLAHWRRPERYLDPVARAAMSGFLTISDRAVEDGVDLLRADLVSGEWRRRNAELLEQEVFDGGYRLLIVGGG